MLCDSGHCFYFKARPEEGDLRAENMLGVIDVAHLCLVKRIPKSDIMFQLSIEDSSGNSINKTNAAGKRDYHLRALLVEDMALWIPAFEEFIKRGPSDFRPSLSIPKALIAPAVDEHVQHVNPVQDVSNCATLIEGWLLKKSPKLMAGWQRRWFCLFDNCHLYYWKIKDFNTSDMEKIKDIQQVILLALLSLRS